jgi:aspartate aminotransferase-like enzyme
MSDTSYILMTPGPVPVPPEVLEVLAKPMEHHRTPEFVALFNRVLKNLKFVFMTEQPVFIHTSTGSGAMESAIVNTLSPGDEVIAIVSGKFGERWADMAEAFGIRVHRLDVEWGHVVLASAVRDMLGLHPKTKAVLTQACETSTGALHPIRELAQVTAKYDAILMVDAITALGALPLPMDEWGVDVMIGGSQKAFMLPTGLSFISFSKKAWAMTETSKCAKFYFDIRLEKKANDAGESLFSAAVTNIRALDLVLDIFLKQGIERLYQRIQTLSRATIESVVEMGLKPFAQVPSPSVTAIQMPSGIDGQKVRSDMETHEHVIVMGGQDALKGKVIRIGNMGAISDQNLLDTLEALAKSINRQKPNTIQSTSLASALTLAREVLSTCPAVVMKAIS